LLELLLALGTPNFKFHLRCSDYLIDPDKKRADSIVQSDLIPLRIPGSGSGHKLVIGHNVSYDRARTSEEYNLQKTGTRLVFSIPMEGLAYS
jgi:DNA mitochondrial polymerase exonuclease domain